VVFHSRGRQNHSVLYREMSFTRRVLFQATQNSALATSIVHVQWNLRTIDTMGPTVLRGRPYVGGQIIHCMELKQVSFVERPSLSLMVHFQRFHCIMHTALSGSNLRTLDSMWPSVLSLVESSSLSRRSHLSISTGLKQVSLVESSSLSRRSHLSISTGLKQVSLVESSSLSRRVPYWRFHCNISSP
jgi:hypothetical protein